MKVERIRDNDYIVHYPSIEDLVNDKPKTPANAAHANRILDNTDRGWYGPGCDSAREFQRRVKEGWSDLSDAVRRKALELSFKPDVLPPAITQSMKRKRVRSDSGSELDIHRVYQGQLDTAWSSTRHELHEQRRRAVYVYVNIGGLHDVSARDTQWRAAAAVRICEVFQRSGFTVEIVVGASASGCFYGNNHRILHTSFTAKPANMPLDLNRLALQATMGWHRTFSFHARCCVDKYEVGGMGSTVQMPSPYIEDCTKGGALVVTVPANVTSFDMAAGVVRMAQRTLEAEGKK